MIEPVIVTGTGRCGSSFVAGILHNDLNISMGLKFEKPSINNPNGYYEDVEIKRNNDDFLKNYKTFLGWATNIKKIMTMRVSRDIPWGFKDPRIADLFGLYLAMFDAPKIIWCIRDKDLVLKSLIEKYQYTQTQAIMQYKSRMQVIGRLLRERDHLQIHFTKEGTKKEDVIRLIHQKWGPLDGD